MHVQNSAASVLEQAWREREGFGRNEIKKFKTIPNRHPVSNIVIDL